MTTAQALQSILGSLVVILALIAQSMLAKRQAAAQHKETTAKLETVEATVNGTHTALTDRVDQLAQALQATGAPIPPSPESTTA